MSNAMSMGIGLGISAAAARIISALDRFLRAQRGAAPSTTVSGSSTRELVPAHPTHHPPQLRAVRRNHGGPSAQCVRHRARSVVVVFINSHGVRFSFQAC